MSYSQYNEEGFILANTPDAGRFLDVGAWNAKQFSNTRALYEKGWSGVMIEPSPEPFLGLLKEYGKEPRIDLLCAAMGFEREGIVILHATADAVSTTDEAVHALWKDAGGYYGKFWTPIVTWNKIMTQFGRFEFVNLDAEGISVDLLHALLATEMMPACICVEHDGRTNEAIEAATGRGYKVVYGNGTNLVLAL